MLNFRRIIRLPSQEPPPGARSPLLTDTNDVAQRLVNLYKAGIAQGYMLEVTVKPLSASSADGLRTPVVSVTWRMGLMGDPYGKTGTVQPLPEPTK